MVDMGIIICENILKKIEHAEEGESRLKLVYEGTSEVGSAVMTAVATTIVSFMPVFAMDGAEGKLFKPLAYTKTFALLASIIVALTILPPMAELLFTARKQFLKNRRTYITAGLYLLCGIAVSILLKWWAGLFFIYVGVKHLILPFVPEKIHKYANYAETWTIVLMVAYVLTKSWLPLGPEKGMGNNYFFVAMVIGGLMLFFDLFRRGYPRMLGWCLNHKLLFLSFPTFVVALGLSIWLGFAT